MAGFGLGIGDGGGLRGKLPAPQREMMREAIDIILKAWTATEPFDWNGNVWQGTNWTIIPKPLTQPRPEVGIACARTDATLELAAEKGFFPLISWTSPAQQVATMIKTYLGTPNAADPPQPDRIRVARYVYVADSVAAAKRDLRDADLVPVRSGKRLDAHIPPGGTIEDLTIDYLIDREVLMVGPPDRVYGQIREFYEKSGAFGTLLLVTGKDWGSNEQRAESMRRFMTEVAPRLAPLAA
jgi:alkanesulfonate monooxygenase SsuD/methylene tetrahydromethanopterin reductase-like flavin-dependent oxidoreductase (luciferase family)